MSKRRMSVTFRQADLEAVMGNIHAGRSTEIVGLGSVGKSNFLRRLMMRDVQERFLYDEYGEQSHCIFMHIDANSLLEPLPDAMHQSQPSAWTGYELLASRLLKSVMTHDLVGHITNTSDPAHPENLFGLYHRMWPGENRHPQAHIVAFRYLEDLVSRIFAAANRPVRLIFMFDEFEKLIDEMPSRFFQCMRSLRDQHKDRILYITAVRQITPLLVPQEQYLAYEPFLELFTDARHFLLPYGPSDVAQTFERLAARQDQPLPWSQLSEQLLAITGGHAGLLRASFAAWAPQRMIHEGLSDVELVSILLSIPAVMDECKTIWRSLSASEQRLLYSMAQVHQRGDVSGVQPATTPMARLLIRKGILLADERVGFEHMRPMIFAAFVYSILPNEPAKRGKEADIPEFPTTPMVD